MGDRPKHENESNERRYPLSYSFMWTLIISSIIGLLIAIFVAFPLLAKMFGIAVSISLLVAILLFVVDGILNPSPYDYDDW